MESWFSRIAKRASRVAGSPLAFACAAGVIVLWLATEPFLGFSDTWQLIINTSTTIVTFLMVFVIQTSQNQDTIAIQLKLDELIRIHKHASNSFIDLEELGEAELSKIRKRYEALAGDARNRGEGADAAFPPDDRTAKSDCRSPRSRLVAESRSRHFPTQISNASGTP